MRKRVEQFWDEIARVESDFGLYVVHGAKEGSLVINSDSDIVAVISAAGELHVLSDHEFEAANRCPVVSRKFEI